MHPPNTNCFKQSPNLYTTTTPNWPKSNKIFKKSQNSIYKNLKGCYNVVNSIDLEEQMANTFFDMNKVSFDFSNYRYIDSKTSPADYYWSTMKKHLINTSPSEERAMERLKELKQEFKKLAYDNGLREGAKETYTALCIETLKLAIVDAIVNSAKNGNFRPAAFALEYFYNDPEEYFDKSHFEKTQVKKYIPYEYGFYATLIQFLEDNILDDSVPYTFLTSFSKNGLTPVINVENFYNKLTYTIKNFYYDHPTLRSHSGPNKDLQEEVKQIFLSLNREMKQACEQCKVANFKPNNYRY